MKRILRLFAVLVLLLSFFAGCYILSANYYEKGRSRLFKMYDELNLGITKEEMHEFYERNRVFGMSMSVNKFKNNSVVINMDFIIEMLGASGKFWSLVLDFESNRLSCVQILDASGEGGGKVKRRGTNGVIYEQDIKINEQ